MTIDRFVLLGLSISKYSTQLCANILSLVALIVSVGAVVEPIGQGHFTTALAICNRT
jgi:hypothetical protein